MKKFMLHGFLTMLVMSMIVGCGGSSSSDTPTDTTKPTITINGANPTNVNQGSTYTDAGATATDNVDEIVNVVTSGSVDTTTVGAYTITYTATDSAGNVATETRTVNVVAVDVDYRAVVGKVFDYTTGSPLSGLNVTIGTQTVTTAQDGSYVAPVEEDGAIERVVVGVSGEGYARISKIVSIEDGDNARVSLDINILPVAFSDTFDATTDFTVQVTDSPANVVIGADSLVLSNGNAPVGEIRAELTPINPALDIDLMPGDLTISNGDPIASFGAIIVNFTDASDNALNLAAGETAVIRIPVSTRGASTPASIPLFYYDDEAGVWVEEGTATLSADGTYYEGTVSHFTTWNADYLYDSVTISGCVQDENGIRIPNATVHVEGKDYNGMASSLTDSDGNFTVDAMQNGTALVSAALLGKVSNVAEIYSPSNVTITDCLILGDVPLSVRLTWGEHPYDLDTHVIGPDNYHIWYVSQGSLSSEPFANLDVDDTDSYGPEVFTALSFPEAGTYHYAIYNYSGSHTPNITNSPARVELMLNGSTTVFTPPAGEAETDTWWNVFDIIVAEDGNMTITPINTWSSNEPSGRLGKIVMPAKK